MWARSSALHYVYFGPCLDVLRIRNVAFSTRGSRAGEEEGGGFTKWSILERVRVFVCGLHSETVSQREKINETGVTGTSPSAFAHTHTHARVLARTRAPRPHPRTHPRAYTICARSPFTHSSAPLCSLAHTVWNIDVLFKSPSLRLCHIPSISAPFPTAPSGRVKTIQR